MILIILKSDIILKKKERKTYSLLKNNLKDSLIWILHFHFDNRY